MALTYAQLRTEVLGWLDEADDTSTVLTNVNNALIAADLERATSHDWTFMLKDPTTTATVVGNREVALAADFDRPLYFWNRTTKAPFRVLSVRDIDTHNAPWNTTAQSHDAILEGRVLRLSYTPTAVHTIEYQYYMTPTEMSADGSFPNIPHPFSRILVYDALLMLSAYSDDLSPQRMSLYQDRIAKLENGLYAFNLDHPREASAQYVKSPVDLYTPRGIVNAD